MLFKDFFQVKEIEEITPDTFCVTCESNRLGISMTFNVASCMKHYVHLGETFWFTLAKTINVCGSYECDYDSVKCGTIHVVHTPENSTTILSAEFGRLFLSLKGDSNIFSGVTAGEDLYMLLKERE
ncbi:DNA-directed RNA polymerases I, II, and III subunit rpabc3-like [Teleopsis dalmanni]|uniref:DNA-directed RNA polymerases I, II, and III subunit rpabc3-like n=1 Tax=Teleopsis dalmanni TaxID=139649 RepID=UPI0018CD720A|nr:DNA-directed RNA polymerases I, II, and III subunit rpabc3-like [Teleopsis dalmanni]